MLRKFSQIILFLVTLSFQTAFGQENDIKVEYTDKAIKKGEIFSIKITIKNQKEWKTEGYPEIKGFKKTSRSISHSQVKIQNKAVLQHNIIQNYVAIEDGQYETGVFDLRVNDKNLRQESIKLTVGEIKKNADNSSSNFIGPKEPSLGQINENIKLELNTNKKIFFEGEGIQVNVSLYVSDANVKQLEFPADINQQVEKIAKILKPENCIEYRTLITSIMGIKVVENSKSYTVYKLFESIYYPIKSQKISFPSVKFELKSGQSMSDNLNLTSTSQSIQIKPIPNHPLKEKVCVGDLNIVENFKSKKIQTGKVIDYIITITGTGNNSKVVFNNISNDSHFDFFSPAIRNQSIESNANIKKTFIYKIYPKEAGNYELGSYFNLIYFNTSKATYDTLKPKAQLFISGEKVVNSNLNTGDIYDNIENLDSSKQNIDFSEIIKTVANLTIVLMIIGMMFIFDIFKGNKKN